MLFCGCGDWKGREGGGVRWGLCLGRLFYEGNWEMGTGGIGEGGLGCEEGGAGVGWRG